MHSFISPTGQIIKTKTIREFAETYGLSQSHARDLACGIMSRYKGWCSTHRRAKKHRERFLTVLVHYKTGEREIIGPSVKGFAVRHGLCANELLRLVNGHRIIYRGWMLEKTHQLAQGSITDDFY